MTNFRQQRRSPLQEEILDRAEALLANASLEDLLAFITPERLSEGAEFSPAAVRYNFRAGGRRFSRAELADALLERLVQANQAAAKVATDGYRYASRAVHTFADADKVIEGILADVEQYYGESLEQDPAAAARERLYLLALLTAERQAESAAALSASDERIIDEYAKIYDLYLEKTGRRLVADLSSRDLAHLISCMLTGATFVGRYSPEPQMETVARAVVRIFWSFTYDAATQTQPTYENEIDS